MSMERMRKLLETMRSSSVDLHEPTMTARGLTRTLSVTLMLLACAAQPARADWTVGVFIGAARTEETSIRLTQDTLSTDVVLLPVRYRSDSLRMPVYYAYRAAFFPRSRWLGVEGEFIHLKVIAETARPVAVEGILLGVPISERRSLGSVVERFSISHGVNLVLLNVVARRGIQGTSELRPRWSFAARFGAGASVPHAESTIGGASLEQYEWGSMSVQAAAGAELRMTPRLSVSGEYKFTHTSQHVSVANGTAQTSLQTHHIVAGIVAHLGSHRID
jgi:opacity protein-like surface antigen